MLLPDALAADWRAGRVGNFSILPWQAVARLVVGSELWNHFAAAVIRARLPIPHRSRSIAGRRLTGESRMNFVALLVHGLSAISVFSDIVSTRLLVTASVFITLLAAFLAALIGVRWSTQLAVPAWLTYLAGILFVILTQAVLASFFLVFTIISARANLTFLPRRDAPHFVDRQERVFPHDALSIRRLRAATL